MAFLPPVPDSKRIPTELFDYLVALVRELGEELDARPVLQEGQIIVAEDKPLTVYVDGVAYSLGVDTIPPMQSASNALVDSDLDVNAGEVVTIQTDPVLRISDLDVNAGEVVTIQTDPVLRISDLFVNSGNVAEISEGSNSNGNWIEFSNGLILQWRSVTPDWTSASHQSWNLPRGVTNVIGQFVVNDGHVGGGPGNAAITVLQGVANSPTEDLFRLSFRDGTDAAAAGQPIIITHIGLL